MLVFRELKLIFVSFDYSSAASNVSTNSPSSQPLRKSLCAKLPIPPDTVIILWEFEIYQTKKKFTLQF